MVRTRHVGSYGLCLREGAVLLVRKARGPYAGLLDLPGGGIEHGETPRQALAREFSEEAGLAVAAADWLSDFSHTARYVNAGGVDEELHHLGFIWRVSLGPEGEARQEADDRDSLGAVWRQLAGLRATWLSPVAVKALAAAGLRTE